MISHRCRHQGRGSVFNRVFTSSIGRCPAARVTLAISSLFSFQSSPPLFYHSTRIGMRCPMIQLPLRCKIAFQSCTMVQILQQNMLVKYIGEPENEITNADHSGGHHAGYTW